MLFDVTNNIHMYVLFGIDLNFCVNSTLISNYIRILELIFDFYTQSNMNTIASITLMWSLLQVDQMLLVSLPWALTLVDHILFLPWVQQY